ncbi:hypothetical protein X777_04316 [Ooceraea biroi]|uniref:DNA-directed DNA polymerase n=1 Tax=Ooceraea biroi TaxID=2015173 RepID=A0A026WKN2_OOCBI|nr:hypothetical protein X777_04316 [Ooceraea biroi]
MFNGEFVAGEKIANKSINTRNRALFRTSNLKEWFAQYVIEPTLASLEEFQERDSGWALSRILDLTVNINKYNPVHAGWHAKVPREIMMKRAVINIQSNDNAYFAWSVIAAFYPAESNVERTNGYPDYKSILRLDGIELPMSLKQINKFELLNKISINVYTRNGKSGTYPYHHHKAYSAAYYVQCSYDNSLSAYRYRRGTDCISWFVEELKALAFRVKAILTANVPMVNLTRKQEVAYHSATHCHICEKPLAQDETRVRDHCHLTGRYRDPAHSNCNLNYKDSYTIPIVFHNLSGYNSHFIIKELANNFKGTIDLLPITKEKYISFTKNVNEADVPFRNHVKLRFIDSLRYLSSSLDKLASFLSKDKLKILRSEFSNLSIENFDLLTRKGVFPYEYVDCVEKLQDTCLPPRESFYSSLTGDTISESDYAHAENIWQRFAIQTLGEYSDLYLKTGVLLLADIFENFRDSYIKSYGLDAAYYYTLPGFTWDAMLKHTSINFELLTDIDMVMFIERGIRGGLSQCSNRYARANNNYMESYDPSKPSSYLMYFDINNLYGWAMCQPLPYANFQWVDDVSDFDVNAIAPDSSTGYILEVDLEYLQHLHDAHIDLPFCPTRDKPPGKRQDKLLATLYDKKRYVIHYHNLQQCTRHGLRITKIHCVLQFAQSAWLRKYIELNTQFRMRATNDCEKNFYKLMNNVVFGKTMENIRNHMDVKGLRRWRMVRWEMENSAPERKEEIGEIRCKRKKEMREGKRTEGIGDMEERKREVEERRKNGMK